MSEYALIGEAYAEKLRAPLEALHVTPLTVPANPDVSAPLRCHADLSLCVCGGAIVASCSVMESPLVNILTSAGIEITAASGTQRGGYPWEASLCACVVGGRLLHNLKYTDAAISRVLEPRRVTGLHVNQGYTRCSVCVVDDGAIITSDKGVHRAALRDGLISLLIRPGYIELPGYETGFIGGASGKLGGCIVFTGLLDAHPDREAIELLIRQRGLTPVYLSEAPIFDIGGILSPA